MTETLLRTEGLTRHFKVGKLMSRRRPCTPSTMST